MELAGCCRNVTTC